MVADSIAYLKGLDRVVMFDAEHFFDGYRANPEFSLSVLELGVLDAHSHAKVLVHDGWAHAWSHLRITVTPTEGAAPVRRSGHTLSIFQRLKDGRWVLGAILDITERKLMEEQRLEWAAKERTLASEKALRVRDAELARISRALAVGELAGGFCFCSSSDHRA